MEFDGRALKAEWCLGKYPFRLNRKPDLAKTFVFYTCKRWIGWNIVEDKLPD